MKINGSIEISGIERVVFYRKNLFYRVHTNTTPYWLDTVRNKRMSNTTMMSIIKNMTTDPNRRVWVHGPTINIERINKKHNKCLCAKPIAINLATGKPVAWTHGVYSCSDLIT
jgi:hypothetical protein